MHDIIVPGTGGAVDGGGRGPDGRFVTGNPGKPKGARRRLTLLLEAILEGQAESLTRQVVQLAEKGDMAALRLCLQRLVPLRRDLPVAFDLPEIVTVADAERASSAVLAAVAEGELTPGEAESVMRLLVAHRGIVESGDIERRLAAIEARVAA
jgi:hypothetical protein